MFLSPRPSGERSQGEGEQSSLGRIRFFHTFPPAEGNVVAIFMPCGAG
jgi:hypothetical protein